MTVRRASLLYDRGEPLRDAWLTFADDELRDELSATAGAIEAFTDGVKKSFLSGLAASRDTMQLRHALEERMRSDLLEQLFNDQLIATGYRLSAKPTRWPSIIDAAAFDEDEPDWAAQTVTWRGQQFASVRITDPGLAHVPSPPKRKGRPGSGLAINEAIERLMGTNCSFCKMSREKAAQLIRVELGAEAYPGSGLSTKSLERHIRQKCGIKAISK